MQEDFLHYLWNFKKFDLVNAKTTTGLPLVLVNPGTPNFNSGPDFFNGQIKIGEELWAGNVEIHIRSSDWYSHGHEKDKNYDNVILHVVWEEDVDIFRKDNSAIPTLELRSLVNEKTLSNYRELLLAPNDKWINCEKDFPGFEDFHLFNWQERLYLERLQVKSEGVLELLAKSGNNWEKVLFHMIARNFGLKVNGGAFQSMAQSIDFKVVQKCRDSQHSLEALFLGQAGMLEKEVEDSYFQSLRKEYKFLKRKFSLENKYVERAKFFRLRPDNFPNLRLSQLAVLYSERPHLFSDIIKLRPGSDFLKIFDVETSSYWKSHYTFEKEHTKRTKRLSGSFVDLLIINTILPLQFCYLKKTGVGDTSAILELIREIKAEKNSVIDKFNRVRPNTVTTALQSQAMLHLKKEYCDKNACLKCALGNILLQGRV